MELETLKKIGASASTYFPMIAWFYIVDKTNNSLHLWILLFATIYSLFRDAVITLFVSLYGGRIGQILKRKGRNAALDHALEKITPKTPRELLLYVTLLTVSIILNIWALVQLLDLRNLMIARYLFAIGGVFLLLGLYRYLRDLWRFCVLIWKAYKNSNLGKVKQRYAPILKK